MYVYVCMGVCYITVDFKSKNVNILDKRFSTEIKANQTVYTLTYDYKAMTIIELE